MLARCPLPRSPDGTYASSELPSAKLRGDIERRALVGRWSAQWLPSPLTLRSKHESKPGLPELPASHLLRWIWELRREPISICAQAFAAAGVVRQFDWVLMPFVELDGSLVLFCRCPS